VPVRPGSTTGLALTSFVSDIPRAGTASVRRESRPRQVHHAPRPTTDSTPGIDVSPELALVDPDLAAELRRHLPPVVLWEPGPRREAAGRLMLSDEQRAESSPPATRHRSRATRVAVRAASFAAVAAAGIVVGIVIAYPGGHAGAVETASASDDHVTGLTTSRPREGGAAAATVAVAPTARRRPPGRTPRTAKSGTKPLSRASPAAPVVRWPRTNAPYFNLILWHAGRRVLDAWPTTSQLRIPSSWQSGGVTHRLERGVYLWFVYPGVGARTQNRYGGLLAHGTFTVH
jgi:hypothetical protein